MQNERAHYVEFSSWPGVVSAVLWGAAVLTCYPILAGWDHDMSAPMRWLVVGGVLSSLWGITVLLGGLTVRVDDDGVFLHLGRVPVVKRAVSFDEILSMRSVQYRPIAEFGGWGVRGTRERRAWTARGDRAVALELTEGRELLIGSDRPQRLEERIRAAGGDRLGRASG
jgi:hypothetical protein